MTVATVACTIQRRLLVNYRVDPEIVTRLLPQPFRPQLVRGWAVAGVCFLRLSNVRPPPMPRSLGLTTENVAHRFAVEWEGRDGLEVGVYVPHRHTDSRVSSLLGGRAFPGDYQLATFHTADTDAELHIDVTGPDRRMALSVDAAPIEDLGSELFDSVPRAMDFFRRGSLGFSPSWRGEKLDGVRLHADTWTADPVRIRTMHSTVFDNEDVFPRGSCTLDSGLVMRNLPVVWRSEGWLRAPSLVAVP